MKLKSLAFLMAWVPATAYAQGTAADYERSAKLRTLTQNKVFRDRVQPNWLADGTRFWYRVDLPESAREYVLVDAAAGRKQPLFDHTRLAAAISRELGAEWKPMHLAIDSVTVTDDGSTLRFRAGTKAWHFVIADNKLKSVDSVPAPPAAARAVRAPQRRGGRSPDGKWIVILKDHNLMLRSTEGKPEKALTTDGVEADRYEWPGTWSPDSRKYVALKIKAGDDRKVTIVESSPGDQLQPRVITYPYLKPGDAIPQHRPHLFDIDSGKEIAVEDQLMPNPWSIDQIRWRADSSEFTLRYNQRGHQVLRVVGVNAATGKTRAIIDEQSHTFIDYAGKSFVHYADASDEMIWMSERDGWCHLYLINASTGAVRNPITRGEWVVRGVDRVDEKSRRIWFRAGGIVPGQDPYYLHSCVVNFDGTGLTVLTEGDGTHSVEWSPDNRFLIDTYSKVDAPPTINLRGADGKLICELERADWTRLIAAGWQPPERFVAKGRDGSTDIHGVIVRPTNFNPEVKYPVIEHIYAGPQSAFAPKRFQSFLSMQAMSELGFIVVQMDGMGTSHRSKAFHDVCCKNLGDAGFPDRMAWLRAAAAKRPWMDLTRVGIYGGSAGGQNALRGLLAHPDFYKVGVADCGCHDNRMDKIWWNELWMGWPIGPHYAEQSNVTQAHKLRGKLMLTVGELDRNVDPASTMQVVNALVRANKDFDFVIVPGGGHGSGESPYASRRRQDFFVRHLLGVEPRR